MRKCALLSNGVVTKILDVEESEMQDLARFSEMLIDITDEVPQPAIGYVLNGNTLQIPQNLSSREEFEIDLNSRKSDFGTKLAKSAVDRIGARNKILAKNGTQVMSLLNQLIGVKALLETGALGTARYSCMQLRVAYTEYQDIFDIVISEINSFESHFGL